MSLTPRDDESVIDNKNDLSSIINDYDFLNSEDLNNNHFIKSNLNENQFQSNNLELEINPFSRNQSSFLQLSNIRSTILSDENDTIGITLNNYNTIETNGGQIFDNLDSSIVNNDYLNQTTVSEDKKRKIPNLLSLSNRSSSVDNIDIVNKPPRLPLDLEFKKENLLNVDTIKEKARERSFSTHERTEFTKDQPELLKNIGGNKLNGSFLKDTKDTVIPTPNRRRRSLIIPRIQTTIPSTPKFISNYKSAPSSPVPSSPISSSVSEQIHTLQLLSSHYSSQLILIKQLQKPGRSFQGQLSPTNVSIDISSPSMTSTDTANLSPTSVSPSHHQYDIGTPRKGSNYFQLNSPRLPLSILGKEITNALSSNKHKDKQKSPISIQEDGSVSSEDLSAFSDNLLRYMKQKEYNEVLKSIKELFIYVPNQNIVRSQIQSNSNTLWVQFHKKWISSWEETFYVLPSTKKELKKTLSLLENFPIDSVFQKNFEKRILLFGISYLLFDLQIVIESYFESRRRDLSLIIKLQEEKDLLKIESLSRICKTSKSMIESDLFCFHRILPYWSETENILKKVYLPILQDKFEKILIEKDLIDFVDCIDLFHDFKHDVILNYQTYKEFKSSIPREVLEFPQKEKIINELALRENIDNGITSMSLFRNFESSPISEDLFESLQTLLIESSKFMIDPLKLYILELGNSSNVEEIKRLTSNNKFTSTNYLSESIFVSETCLSLCEEISFLFQRLCKPIYSELHSTLFDTTKQIIQSYSWIVREYMQRVISSQPSSEEMLSLYIGCNILSFLGNQCHTLQRYLFSQSRENIDTFNGIAFNLTQQLKKYLIKIIEKHLQEIKEYIIIDIEGSDWQSFRPFQAESRCNYGIEMWFYYMRGLIYDIEIKCKMPITLSTEIIGHIIVQSLRMFLSTYESIIPSRMRTKQYMCDISYIIYFSRMLRSSTNSEFMHHVNKYCVFLAALGATFCCPMNNIFDFLTQSEDVQENNRLTVLKTLEYEQSDISKVIPPNIWHPNPIQSQRVEHVTYIDFYTVIDYHTSPKVSEEFHKNMWEVSYDWETLLKVCLTIGLTNTSFEFLERILKRHEFASGEYPDLSTKEKDEALKTLQILRNLKENLIHQD